ncbi:MAG: Ribose-phosphate pyrophosphokinase [Candidatus Amesbacteria bacterium GW2011_GWA1_47_16]|uniref:Ribose-phosphate pyrophosphokinase n=3 Tax=Candidatus Amesiibacteriota TaxID=1752730 RepID=A0A0G1RZW9_9BACT|nr:MAG: Ribose-phosphate pyrophosphokinase [Candidatus Amesbacteria bacterium GW2011_GWC1_47_15]KKU62979.1 MAG: Ribose-phosphate pyrophosphokinase [Candidatus Amesbacteria bacterium GW2011_GWA1_47_16]OGD00782.1 MAG: hypothetical protein A2972_04010 [Candidatus Amesbacteria bacterium RIFCSPLOWO2_01_FULL_47_33]
MNDRKGNVVLAAGSASHLGPGKVNSEIKRLADGEISLQLKTDVSDSEVIVIGSTQPPADNFLELLMLLNTAVQQGAKKT